MVLIEMWEFDFDRLVKINKKLNEHIKNRCFKEILNSRNVWRPKKYFFTVCNEFRIR